MMDKPNFKEMDYKELYDYVLAHREDEEAFHAFADMVYAMPNQRIMPPLKSPEDAENYPDFMEYLRKGSERHRNRKA